MNLSTSRTARSKLSVTQLLQESNQYYTPEDRQFPAMADLNIKLDTSNPSEKTRQNFTQSFFYHPINENEQIDMIFDKHLTLNQFEADQEVLDDWNSALREKRTLQLKILHQQQLNRNHCELSLEVAERLAEIKSIRSKAQEVRSVRELLTQETLDIQRQIADLKINGTLLSSKEPESKRLDLADEALSCVEQIWKKLELLREHEIENPVSGLEEGVQDLQTADQELVRILQKQIASKVE